jgi:hypothetical protein
MKTRTHYILLLAISGLAINFSSCDKTDDPTAQELQLRKLTGKTWVMQSVSVDGVDRSSLFDNMQLTITENTFTTTNGGRMWPASESWRFSNTQGTVVERGDQLVINILEVTAVSLKLSLTWTETTFSPGRSKSIAGEYIFSFN